MENPEPVREHRELEKLAGHFAGPERMYPSWFNDEAKKAEAITDARIALDGFAVVQDYEQRLEDGSRFAGHGVFRYDMPSDTYEMHWFDSTGGPVRIFRGGFADRMLVLTARAGEGWQRLTYDFNLAGGYRFKLETSGDGNEWRRVIEGDNFADGEARTKASTPRARKTAAKTAGRKASAKKSSAKKAPAKQAAKKAAAKKATAKKTTAKKATAKKAAAKKATAKKATAKKATATRTVAKKKSAGAKAKGAAATRKTAPKKAASGKKTAKKAAASPRAASIERSRRQGKSPRTIATKKKAGARANGSAASRRSVSQKKTKASAQEAPRMPNLKKTSTRTGWHRTAAKGVR